MSGFNGIVWLLSVVLAVVFVVVGVTRAYRYEQAKKVWGWVSDVPQSMVQTIGLVEMICGVGLVLPVAIGKYIGKFTVLTPIAASILMLMLIMAIGFHVRRHEKDQIPVVVLLLIMLGVVFYGRVDLLAAL